MEYVSPHSNPVVLATRSLTRGKLEIHLEPGAKVYSLVPYVCLKTPQGPRVKKAQLQGIPSSVTFDKLEQATQLLRNAVIRCREYLNDPVVEAFPRLSGGGRDQNDNPSGPRFHLDTGYVYADDAEPQFPTELGYSDSEDLVRLEREEHSVTWEERLLQLCDPSTQANLALLNREWYQRVRKQPLTLVRGDQGTYLLLTTITRPRADAILRQSGHRIPIEGGRRQLLDFAVASGHHGELRLALDGEGRVVGIKITRGEHADPREIEIQQQYLQNLPLIVPLRDWAVTSDTVYQVMDFAGLGSCRFLRQLFSREQDPHFSQALLFHVAYHLFQALISIHERGVYHRDVKPDNLVINQIGDVQLIDFGCAVHPDGQTIRFAGTRGYRPPEFFLAREQDGEKVDAWMAGLTLYTLLQGSPYRTSLQANVEGLDFVEMKDLLSQVSPSERPQVLQSYVSQTLSFPSDGLGDLLQKLLACDPDERWTVEQALAHPWMEGMRLDPLVRERLVEYAQTRSDSRAVRRSPQDLPLPHFANYLERPRLQEELLGRLNGNSNNSNSSDRSAPIVIQGMPGVGKTQLVNFVLHKLDHPGMTIWLYNTRQRGLLESQLLLLVHEWSLAEGPVSFEEAVSLINDYIAEQEKPFLIVYDDAGEPDSLIPYLPKNGRVMITTQSTKWDGSIEVPPMLPEEASKLIEHLLGPTGQSEALGIRLGGLPLALVQACAYIRNRGLSVGNYLEALDQEDHLRRNEPLFFRSLPSSIAELWSLTFKELQNHSPSSFRLLEQIAYLSPEAIPSNLLTRLAPDGIQPLVDYHLLEPGPSNATYQVHTLLQEVVLYHAKTRKERDLAEILDVLNRLYIDEPRSAAEKQANLALLPHGQTLLTHAEDLQISVHQTLIWVGRLLLDDLGQARMAAAMFEKGQTGTDLEKAIALIHLGEANLALEQFPEVFSLVENALKLLEGNPEAYKERAFALNTAGLALKLSHPDKAIDCYKKALELLKEHDPTNINCALYLNNLALVKKNTSPEEALVLFREVEREFEKHYSSDHPRRAVLMTNLGSVYAALGRPEALMCYTDALGLAQKSYHSEHPRLAVFHANLASALIKTGDKGAIAHYVQALDILDKHPASESAIKLRLRMGEAYIELGKREKGRQIIKRAYLLAAKSFGREAPFTHELLQKLTRKED